jgi:hypothetical protein
MFPVKFLSRNRGKIMRITNAKVKDAKNETGKPIWIHDDELTGLALSISPRGKKTW